MARTGFRATRGGEARMTHASQAIGLPTRFSLRAAATVAVYGGAGARAGSVGRSVIVATLVALGSVIYAFGFEEERLERRFGTLWAAYRRTTPAFPALLPAPLRSALVTLWQHCRRPIERIANRVVFVRVRATTWVTFGVFAAAAAA